jgi:integrase/recombinase XerD
MKVLKIFENKLRVKNYSDNTIKTYIQTLSQFLKETNCKDPYQIRLSSIISFLETKNFSSVSQQNQFIGCLKLFARYILNKKEVHLSKIERPRSEKKLPQIIDKEFLLNKISKIEN